MVNISCLGNSSSPEFKGYLLFSWHFSKMFLPKPTHQLTQNQIETSIEKSNFNSLFFMFVCVEKKKKVIWVIRATLQRFAFCWVELGELYSM